MIYSEDEHDLPETIYVHKISLKCIEISQFLKTRSADTSKLDQLTLVGFFYEIKSITENALNELTEVD